MPVYNPAAFVSPAGRSVWNPAATTVCSQPGAGAPISSCSRWTGLQPTANRPFANWPCPDVIRMLLFGYGEPDEIARPTVVKTYH